MNSTVEKTEVRIVYDEGIGYFRDESGVLVDDNVEYPLPWGGSYDIVDTERRPVDTGPPFHDSYVVWTAPDGTRLVVKPKFVEGTELIFRPDGVEEVFPN